MLPSNFTATQVDQGANGTVTANTVPDIVAKIAFDTKFGGLPFHADLAGLYRRFQINTFVPASGINADASANGYGGSYNMLVNVAPNLVLVENAFAAKAKGRYESPGSGRISSSHRRTRAGWTSLERSSPMPTCLAPNGMRHP